MNEILLDKRNSEREIYLERLTRDFCSNVLRVTVVTL